MYLIKNLLLKITKVFNNLFLFLRNSFKQLALFLKKTTYFQEKRFTFVIFTTTITLSILISIGLHKYLVYQPSPTLINLDCDQEYINLNNIDISFIYDTNRINIVIYYDNYGENEDHKSCYLITSDNLNIVDSFNISEIHKQDKNNYYRIELSDDNSFSIYFSSDLINYYTKDIKTQFQLIINNSVYTKIPTEIKIYGGNDIVFNTIYPEPYKFLPSLIKYELKDFDYDVYFILHGTNFLGEQKSQYILFFGGTILGITLSIASQILIEFLSAIEKRQIK